MEPKLRVVIKLDIDGRQVRLEVRGRVTVQNSKVLYVLARRANTAVPGLDVVLDLRKARVGAEAMAGLNRCSETGKVPVLTGALVEETFAPRQLSILNPAA